MDNVSEWFLVTPEKDWVEPIETYSLIQGLGVEMLVVESTGWR